MNGLKSLFSFCSKILKLRYGLEHAVTAQLCFALFDFWISYSASDLNGIIWVSSDLQIFHWVSFIYLPLLSLLSQALMQIILTNSTLLLHTNQWSTVCGFSSDQNCRLQPCHSLWFRLGEGPETVGCLFILNRDLGAVGVPEKRRKCSCLRLTYVRPVWGLVLLSGSCSYLLFKVNLQRDGSTLYND